MENDKKLAADHMIGEIDAGMSDKDFQREFYESLKDQFEKTESLSNKQFECLTKIYNRISDL